ncbi:MAG: hypothetical protein R3264_09465 [Anaerolineae bacterium]|nr:hypothetical protein [Anaerolineae bacterium]
MLDLKKKLQLKDDFKGAVLNKPNDVSLPGLPEPSGVDGPADYVIVFVNDRAEVERFVGQVVQDLREDGLLWLCYPKKSSGIKTDITRDAGWEPLTQLNFRPVRQISIDKTWSALRFREQRFVK